MPAQQGSWIATAYLETGTIAKGQVACLNEAGTRYVVASDANRTAAGRRSACIAITAGDADDPGGSSFEAQYVGVVPPSVSGLGAGTESLVRVSTTGVLERVATYSSADDVCGHCDEDGTAYLCFPMVGMSAAVWMAPGGSSYAIQYRKADGTFGGATNASVNSSGGYLEQYGARVLAASKTSFPEMFGAVGDGAADDTTAMAAAMTAMSAGTYGALAIGCTNHKVSGLTLPNNAKIFGRGSASSVITSTTNAIVLTVASGAQDVEVRDLKISGNSAGSSQHGIAQGEGSDVAPSRARYLNLDLTGLYHGMRLANGPAGVHGGAVIDGCSFTSNVKGLLAIASGEYLLINGCTFRSNTAAGLAINGGNASVTNCNINDNTAVGAIAIQFVAGGNDAHGMVSNCNINHNDTAIDIGAITNAQTFSACNIYDGKINVNGNTGLVTFVGCQIDFTTLTNTNGKVRFVNCTFSTAYYSSITESGTGWTEFINCIGKDGTVPSWIASRVSRSYTFPSDANQTLSWQDSVAQQLVIAAGVITAGRTLTHRFGPADRRTYRIVNKTAFTITFGWSSGSTVTIATNTAALVGSDGTNAIVMGT